MDVLDEKTLSELAARVRAYPYPREMVVDVLRAIQERRGWVSDEGVELAAQLLRISPLEVEEVATFYDKIYRRPVGRKVIHLCDSVCCFSRGGEDILKHLEKRLQITLGQTTPDGMFTLLPTCCLGACGQAPAMSVNLRLYGHLTPEAVDRILEEERREVSP
ncbi:MAG: NADH-quinone oxidoreductase subunit NuoE [Myxococcales bacterium]|nr:NADH-quinone oxidoreductase subunit NuoE [Myxococcales bacterium]